MHALLVAALLHGARSTDPTDPLRVEDYVKLTDKRLRRERGERDGRVTASTRPASEPTDVRPHGVDPGCPYLHYTLPALEHSTPCQFGPCVTDSDGCECLLHQVAYCDQDLANDRDPFCASMATWDPSLLETIERCRGEKLALEAFADCPFLEQTDMLPSAPLEFDTPCRYQPCIVDSDSCACLHYQRKYCEQHDPSTTDGMCVILTRERTLALDVLAAHCPTDVQSQEANESEPSGAAARCLSKAEELSLALMKSECESLNEKLESTEDLLLALQRAYTAKAAEMDSFAQFRLSDEEEEERMQSAVTASAKTVFDDIVAKTSPAEIVFEDDATLAFRDINPVAPVHVLVVPKRHISALSESTTKDTVMLGRLMNSAREVANKEGLSDGGFRVVVNDGKAAGQTIPYLHLHVIGGKQLRWPPL